MLNGLRQAAAETKLSAPLEISQLRKTDRGGLGSYFVCLREVNPAPDKRFVYAAFFDDDIYKGARQSVILEACEAEVFTQVELPPPPSPSPTPSSSPKPGRGKRT
jgi:hypothetical protein